MSFSENVIAPWSTLSTVVNGVMTAEEAVLAGGLDWDVSLEKIYSNGELIKSHKAVTRSSDSKVLGVVGNRYAPVQNRDAFSFLDAVVGDGELQYHTVGSLQDGRRVWLLARMKDRIVLPGVDLIDQYLLFSNSFDGTTSLNIAFTPIRVICSNTLNMALKNASSRATIRHTSSAYDPAMISRIRNLLGLASEQFRSTGESYKLLAEKSIDGSQLRSYISEIFPSNTEEPSSRIKNIHSKVEELFETGMGADLDSARGTLWGAYNAVTEYVDHHRSTECSKRLYSIWYGTGNTIKDAALDTALKLAA